MLTNYIHSYIRYKYPRNIFIEVQKHNAYWKRQYDIDKFNALKIKEIIKQFIRVQNPSILIWLFNNSGRICLIEPMEKDIWLNTKQIIAHNISIQILLLWQILKVQVIFYHYCNRCPR